MEHENAAIPVALTIAGSDSGGGAGIQADLRTFHAFHVFGASVITALTSQNPLRVSRVLGADYDSVQTQLAAVFEVLNISAVKTGMLFSVPVIRAVCEVMSSCRKNFVMDPVMISTSGSPLLQQDAVDTVRRELLPLADWVTPNIPEAEILAGMKITTAADLREAARKIAGTWDVSVVLKGGHAPDADVASDIVCHEGILYELKTPRLKVLPRSDHGTGCTFSAALAAAFARGEDWYSALISAKAFVYGSLTSARSIGNENHVLYGMYPPPAPDDFINAVRLEIL